MVFYVAAPSWLCGVVLALFAGGAGGVAAGQLKLADIDPHDGVARAHAMPVQGIDVSQLAGRRRLADSPRRRHRVRLHQGDRRRRLSRSQIPAELVRSQSAGVPRGAYHMLYWCRPAHEQALWFILNVPYDPDALPPVLDLEWNHHSRNCPNGAPADVALEKIKIMLEVMESHTGKRPIIYTDVAFYRDVLEGELQGYNFWLRSVAAEPQAIYGNRPWLFWQFTTTGYVPGIDGPVDRNAFNGSFADWRQVLPRGRKPVCAHWLRSVGARLEHARDRQTLPADGLDRAPAQEMPHRPPLRADQGLSPIH